MADETPKQSIPTNLPGNSYSNPAKKVTVEETKEKVTKKVISGEAVQKVPFGRKVRQSFTGDDAQSIGSYILFDVLIPQAKNLFFDILTQSTERALWGASRPGVKKTTSGYSSYGSMYKSNTPRPGANPNRATSGVDPRTRRLHDIENIVLSNRADAEMVISELLENIDEYGVARVSELLEMVGMTSNWKDREWGWTDLSNASSSAIKEGYILNFPKPSLIE